MSLILQDLWDDSDLYMSGRVVRAPTRETDATNKRYVDTRRKVFAALIEFNQAANCIRYYFPEGKPTKKELGADTIEYFYFPYKIKIKKLCIAIPDYNDLVAAFAGSIEIGIGYIDDIDNTGGDVIAIQKSGVKILIDNVSQLSDNMAGYDEHLEEATFNNKYFGYVLYIETSATFPVASLPRILVTWELEERDAKG